MKKKISSAQRALYRSLSAAGGSVALSRLTGREEQQARRLAAIGAVSITEDSCAAVVAWEVPAEYRGQLSGEADETKLIDWTDRDEDWKRPRSTQGKHPVLCVAVTLAVYEVLREAGPDRVRELLAHIARLGHDKADDTLRDQPLTLLDIDGSKVYGVAIPADQAPILKGGKTTSKTGLTLRLSACVGIDAAITALESA